MFQYESVYERDLRLVYDGQNSLNQLVRTLHNKVGELTKEVNNLHSIVNSRGPPSGDTGGASKQEINTMISLQNQVHNAVQDLQSRSSKDDKKKLEQLEQSVQVILENVGHILTKTQDFNVKPPPCPTVSCITPGNFMSLLLLGLVVFGAYIGYKNRADQQSKKFY